MKIGSFFVMPKVGRKGIEYLFYKLYSCYTFANMSSSRMSIWSVLPPRDTECDVSLPFPSGSLSSSYLPLKLQSGYQWY